MSEHVRAVQERRRSGAAGPHGRVATRAELLADALADQLGDHEDDDTQEES